MSSVSDLKVRWCSTAEGRNMGREGQTNKPINLPSLSLLVPLKYMELRTGREKHTHGSLLDLHLFSRPLKGRATSGRRTVVVVGLSDLSPGPPEDPPAGLLWMTTQPSDSERTDQFKPSSQGSKDGSRSAHACALGLSADS